ncbi:flagellar M-ring protein FliF [Pseudomonas aeruginosa]|uniref:Flagellar M-ring protein n=1 Tax=Pseudomonas aeruginosa TaxID=287 RepID=A0A367MCW6_PSEAI|nr:flagellar M-ring protein FliF [Pseudomonas aeruginosa]
MADALIDSQVPAKSGGAGMLKKSFPGLSFLDNLSEMTMLRQIGLLVGLAASVAIGFAVVLWSQQPDYKPLYGSLNGVDANRVVEALTAADIPYKVEPNSGALLVKADDLGRARMKVASAGVAPTDNNVGFEILDKEQALGTSQFMEATNYRRGLEGELARTVSSLNNVKAARVHLAIPKSSVFVRDDRKPSASVLVELYPGRSLEPSQVMAIVNLVATSVPELDKSQVTVVDQKGNLLSDQQELSELTMAGKQFDFTRRMEGLLTQRVHNILQPVLGNGRYKAEVSADVDFSAVESTSEMYNPDQPALRSEQRNNEERQNSSGPQGVPGALSNQPPGPASAPQQATASAPADYVAPGQPLKDANGQTIIDPKTGKPELAPYPTDKRDQTTRNYELDRSISYTKQQQGRLRRLSVAVVLDDAWQGITDIVRGADLLDSTPRQLYLQELLGLSQPRYLHVPLIVQPDGHKLGKSYRSPPLPAEQAAAPLTRALRALGQRPPADLAPASATEALAWGVAHWDATRIPRCATLPEERL